MPLHNVIDAPFPASAVLQMPTPDKDNQQDNNEAAGREPSHRSISTTIVTASLAPVAMGTRPPSSHVLIPTIGFPVFCQTVRDPWIRATGQRATFGFGFGITPTSPPQITKKTLVAIAEISGEHVDAPITPI
jgi:hypothetical protein